jgi:hypothetical protein
MYHETICHTGIDQLSSSFGKINQTPKNVGKRRSRSRGQSASVSCAELPSRSASAGRRPGRPCKYTSLYPEGQLPPETCWQRPDVLTWQPPTLVSKVKLTQKQMLNLLGDFLGQRSRVLQRAARLATKRQDLGQAQSLTLVSNVFADTSTQLAAYA